MISFIQVIDVIKTFSVNHLQLQKFDFDFREQMPNLATVNEAYPMLYVVPVGTTNIQFGKEFELDIYCVDRYKKDRSNVGYVISDTELILSDLSVYLENQTAFDSSYGNTTPINNDLLDYVGGHVMRIRVTVEKQALCEIPFDGEQPAPPTCPSALIRNSDGSWTEIVASGATYILPDTPVTVRNVSGDEVGSGDVPSVTGGVVTVPDCPVSGDGTAVLKDTDGNVLSTTSVAPETTVDIIAPDADYEIRKSNNAILYQGSIPSGGALVQNIQDSMVRVRKSDNQLIAEVDVRAESVENYNVADSTAVLKDSAGNTLSTTAIKATESEDITAPDTTLQVNGVTEGTHVAGSTIGINLSDGTNPVTPDIVTKVGDNYAVVLPACPPAVTRSTATLMKTGQTTSYRTGDDGNIQAGRATDFFTLDAAPVHNDGSPTINTTTNRFTDINGLQVYGDDIVLDWSTWNGSTLLGYYRLSIGVFNWDNAIDNCLSHSVGSFTSGWRLWNVREMQNVLTNNFVNNGLEYAPFNQVRLQTWTSTTNATGTTQAIFSDRFLHIQSLVAKTVLLSAFACRTFTLSTSNILS